MNGVKGQADHLSRARLIGALLGGIAGAGAGWILVGNQLLESRNWLLMTATITYGAVLVYLVMPLFTRSAARLGGYFDASPPQQILATGLGVAGGLGVAALAGLQLSALPNGQAVTFAGAVVLALLGARLGNTWGRQVSLGSGGRERSQRWMSILDSSAAIDDRLADLAHTGVLGEALVVTTAVTQELQRMADKGDPEKVLKGRKGLNALADLRSSLRDEPGVEVVFRETIQAEREVDDFLLKLSREMGAPLVTTDATLTARARAEGLRVIDINQLAVALKPKLLPETEILLTIAKQGTSPNQGVGYLEDGTMVVVNDGGSQVGNQVKVTITSVLQQASGRMVFARIGPAKGNKRPR